MTLLYWIGFAITAVAFPLLVARRRPGSSRWVAVGVVVGLVAALVWPVTLWIAVALWLTWFGRPGSPPSRRRVVLPLTVTASLATIVGIGLLVGPRPAAAPTAPLSVAGTAVSTTTAAPAAPTTAATTVPLTPTATQTQAVPAPVTAVRLPAATTTTQRPEPAARPQPEPRPRPEPRPDPVPEAGDGRSGTGPRTGNSGHPCLPGERDGDNDGYCGEGR